MSPVLSELLTSGAQVPQVSISQRGMGTGSPTLPVVCFTVGLGTEGGDASGWTRGAVPRIGALVTPPTPGSQARDSFLDGELLVEALAHLRPSHSSDLK